MPQPVRHAVRRVHRQQYRYRVVQGPAVGGEPAVAAEEQVTAGTDGATA